MSYALLWLSSLAAFWASFALKDLWLRKHRAREKGWHSFEILAGASLLAAGASSFRLLEPLFPLWLAILLMLALNGALAIALRSLGKKSAGRLAPLAGLAEFIALLFAPLAAFYGKAEEKLALGEQSDEMICVLEGEKRRIVEGALDLEETIVREIMVPRLDLVALRAEATIAEAVKTANESGHSRFPAYEGTVDNIVGIIHVKDLLRKAWEGKWDEEVRNILRPPYFVPETKNAAELLREMQRQRIHMAIVVDEYGGTAGIITLEDLLEEILGEIQDEYDREEPLVREVTEGEYIVDGRLSIEDLEEIIGKELELEGIDTVGGLVYSKFGKVPEKGAHFQLEGFDFEVLSLLGRRIGKVRLRKIMEEKGENESGKGETVEQAG